MTQHCATCTCGVGEQIPQPSTSSDGAREKALMVTRSAVRAAKEKRNAGYGGQR